MIPENSTDSKKVPVLTARPAQSPMSQVLTDLGKSMDSLEALRDQLNAKLVTLCAEQPPEVGECTGNYVNGVASSQTVRELAEVYIRVDNINASLTDLLTRLEV